MLNCLSAPCPRVPQRNASRMRLQKYLALQPSSEGLGFNPVLLCRVTARFARWGISCRSVECRKVYYTKSILTISHRPGVLFETVLPASVYAGRLRGGSPSTVFRSCRRHFTENGGLVLAAAAANSGTSRSKR